MTAERDHDSDATVKMPRVNPESSPEVSSPEVDEALENIDPESTLVRDDWESTVIRRVAPHVAAVQSEIAEDSAEESRFGWESEGLKRLAHEVRKAGV